MNRICKIFKYLITEKCCFSLLKKHLVKNMPIHRHLLKAKAIEIVHVMDIGIAKISKESNQNVNKLNNLSLWKVLSGSACIDGVAATAWRLIYFIRLLQNLIHYLQCRWCMIIFKKSSKPCFKWCDMQKRKNVQIVMFNNDHNF